MNMRLFSALLFVTVISQLSSVNGIAAVGTTGGQFLKINPSARSAGMAGASAALADDVFALYADPAGLASLEKAELAATYIQYFAGVNYGFLGYASKLNARESLGFGYTYLLIGDIEKRGLDEALQGTFNAQDTSVSVSYGRSNAFPSLIENVDAGATLRLISSQIDQTVACTAALDLAARYRAASDLSVALVLSNISPGIRFKESTDPYPLDLKMGIAYRPDSRLTLCSDIDEYLADNRFYASVGGEYRLVPQLALRAGYRFGYDTESLGGSTGLGLGLGFRIWSAGLDYAFVPFGDLGDTHRFTFTLQF